MYIYIYTLNKIPNATGNIFDISQNRLSGFLEILLLSKTINLKNAFQFSVESACKICRYSILIIRGVILKVTKNDKNTMCGGKG